MLSHLLRASRSFAKTGSSWAPFGSFLAPVCVLFSCTVFTSILNRFLVQLGPNLAPTWPSKSNQNGQKIDVKSICFSTSILDTFLIEFWTYLGALDTPKTLKKTKGFFKVFAKFAWCSSIPSWTPFGAQIWSIFGAKLRPSWTKNRSKNIWKK